MVGLYKDPKGDNIFTKSSIGNPDSLQNAGLSESVSLKKRISELETELATLVRWVAILWKFYTVEPAMPGHLCNRFQRGPFCRN